MDNPTFEALIASLESAAIAAESVIRQVPAGLWNDVIQTGDGGWTRRQLLAHMAANDLRQLVRIRIGAGAPEPGDDLAHAAELGVHDWNRGGVAEREGSAIETLVAEMRANRAALVRLLRSLSPAQRDRMMPFRGEPTPLANLVPVLIGHLDTHAAELLAGTPSLG